MTVFKVVWEYHDKARGNYKGSSEVKADNVQQAIEQVRYQYNIGKVTVTRTEILCQNN